LLLSLQKSKDRPGRADMIELWEAAEVWELSHIVFIKHQSPRTGGGEGMGTGIGVSSGDLDWSASVRKLINSRRETVAMDLVYGDMAEKPSKTAKDVASIGIWRLRNRLDKNRELIAEGDRIRKKLF